MRRTRNVLKPLALVAVLALALAACGSDDGADTKPSGSKKPTKAERVVDAGGDGGAEQATAELEVRMTDMGSKSGGGVPIPTNLKCTRSIPATCTGKVVCPIEAGAVYPEEVCAWLAEESTVALLTEPVPERQACTMIYGGPEVATITGTLGDAAVDVQLGRNNGCAIDRFEMASTLWTGVPVYPKGAKLSAEAAAAGQCAPVGTPDGPDAGAGDGSGADDTACGTSPQPEIITDPPEAFER